MSAMPRDPLPDSTLALLADPYGFIRGRCRRYGSDAFEARLLLRRTICLTGPLAARVFYDKRLFQRAGAAPEGLRATLFGKGAVQGLDGEAHRVRKAMFLRVLTPSAVADLAARTRAQWSAAAATWTPGQDVVLYTEAQRVLTEAVCAWAGLPAGDVAWRQSRLVPLFDDAARGLSPHVHARATRWRAQSWLRQCIDAVRRGSLEAPPGSALHAVAVHRDVDGAALSTRVASVELLNLLRPVVAISVYVTFVAHALHRYVGARAAASSGDPQRVRWLLDEVRRYYPFFPAVAARVREDFEWEGYRFPRGRRVLFDLYGTNHDPRAWEAPERFMPERFAGRTDDRYGFVPQGGSDAATNHRCPGEETAVAVMGSALDFLQHELRYTVRARTPDLDMRRLPAVPRDGMRITVTGRA